MNKVSQDIQFGSTIFEISKFKVIAFFLKTLCSKTTPNLNVKIASIKQFLEDRGKSVQMTVVVKSY